ncbi:hypothetical protein V1264_006839 [Littorina saxatilis]|uniref:Tox-ART-HYD1 domain-containing protein n=1 Tax=Littorina saxatilis TaxID=31220 RepID=A0AAN9G6A4_9CAEN
MEVYHYTSNDGLKAIEKSGFIEESSLVRADDAAFGTGVYLTTLTPEQGRQRIASNNYGSDLAHKMEQQGRVECAIKLLIPRNMLDKAKSDRDVWIHRGRVFLNVYNWTKITWEKKGFLSWLCDCSVM